MIERDHESTGHVPDNGLRPRPDLTFRIDARTQEYVGYQEYRQGSLVIAPRDFMRRRYPEVLTPLGALESFERAVEQSRTHHGRPETLDIDIRGVSQRLTVRWAGAFIHVDAVELAG